MLTRAAAAARLEPELHPRPRLRAEVFEFLSDVPRVRVDEHATDALGRPAVALSQDSGGGRLELMFDRSTYRFLGSRHLDLKPRPAGSGRAAASPLRRRGTV